jgi:hypothetical protein
MHSRPEGARDSVPAPLQGAHLSLTGVPVVTPLANVLPFGMFLNWQLGLINRNFLSFRIVFLRFAKNPVSRYDGGLPQS